MQGSSGPARRGADPSTRESRRRAALSTWLCNVLLGTLVGLAYLRDLPEGESVRVWLFAHLGLLSTVVTLTLVPALATALLARTKLGDRALGRAQALVWMLVQIALYTDTRVYRLFGYHLNSAAWNLLTSRGSEDSYRLGPRIWIPAFAIAAALFALETLLWRWMLARASRPDGARTRRRFLRPALLCCAALALAVCVEKSIYAQADLVHDRRVTAVSQLFPMYPRLSVKRLLPSGFGASLDDSSEVQVGLEDAQLAYPRSWPEVPRSGPRPNVLVLVIDSWRQDMLDGQVTPNMERFARDARRFADHDSGGNGTRFGVFALLYGLHGSYWWPVLDAHRSPVLVDALERSGYDLEVFSSASMDYPEFRSTAWVRIPERVHDDFGELRPSVRDERCAELCEQWWRARRASAAAGADVAPFFAFVLLDSAHQTYDFPADEALFTPFAEELDYLELSGSRDPELALRVKHRYMNALHHADRVAGAMLDDLARSGELDHTLVIVTGDHGEEFAEHGFWGHTGNFTREQISVPFMLRGPGVAPGVELRPTSHVDVACTLLELLGADPASRREWTVGENLLAPLSVRDRVFAGWEEVGLETPSGTFRIPRSPDRVGCLCVCDEDWVLLADQERPFRVEERALRRLSDDCLLFLRHPGALAPGSSAMK